MKNVLIDHSRLGRFCGFAEISENFGKILAGTDVPDIHFVYMVPRRYFGHFGDNVSYISSENPSADLKALGIVIDLWHSTDQLFAYRSGAPGTKRLLTVHDLIWIHGKKGRRKIKAALKHLWKILCSDCIAVVSDYVAGDLKRHFGFACRRVVTIQDAVRKLELEPRVKPAFADENKRYFLSVGQLKERKNFESIIAMMSRFPEYRLYICGVGKEKYTDELKSLAQCPEVAGRVTFAGVVSDCEKNWLYAHCTAFLMPSRMEGFGLPVLEAMRFGKPVFCANATSLPEVGGRYAFYWNDFIPEAMAETVRSGLASFSAETDGAAEKEYSEKFSYTEYTRRYIDLYREILSTSTPGTLL